MNGMFLGYLEDKTVKQVRVSLSISGHQTKSSPSIRQSGT